MSIERHHHFLIVCLTFQGQIIPCRNLARRLARVSGAHVTIATPLSSHRRLFRNTTATAGECDDATEEAPLNPENGSGIIAYAPYSDGFDDGFNPYTDDGDRYMSSLKSVGFRTLTTLARSLAARGRPVSCIIYTILLTFAADVARDVGVPSILYWIQPASLFAIYHHHYRRHPAFTASATSVELPGLPPLREKDLPSVLVAPSPYSSSIDEIFVELDKSEKPRVLVNTFRELEASVIDGVNGVELITIGPLVEKQLEADDAGGYMEWLDKQEERSVVYVAFGSLTQLTERQAEEVAKGLRESRQPFLWVMRKDNRRPEWVEAAAEGGKEVVVEWCSQVRVLGHGAVGCFVTHCGWNSMSEAMSSGVPMVMMPEWMDQNTNARLAAEAWGVGVRVEAGVDGVVEAAELRRCIGIVTGEEGEEIQRRAKDLKEKATDAITENGPSTKNLITFLGSLL